MESLSGLSAFVYAAEQRSYVGAGRVLGISSSAIAKSVARLEADLGVRLLHRTTRRIQLTEEGAVFYERCKRILDDLNDACTMMSASSERPKGRLRISVPHIVGHNLLMPLLPAFLRQFPEIEPDIDFEDHVVDLIGEGIDVAIRSGDPADTRLICRRLGEQHFVVCGSDDYLARYSCPKTPDELIRHRCIHFKYPSSGRLAQWSFGSPYAGLRLPGSLIFNNTNAGLSAAIEGLGLAHLPVYVAAPAISTGVIRPVLTDFMVPSGSLSLLWPSRRQLSAKVRAFVDFVVEQLQDNPAIFNAAT